MIRRIPRSWRSPVGKQRLSLGSNVVRLVLVPLMLAACTGDSGSAAAQVDSTPPEHPVANRSAEPPRRTVAVTFDDLPVSRDRAYGLERMQDVTRRLLSHLQQSEISAVGFVNEGKLDNGTDRRARIALLEEWLDAGMELGNHTFAHSKFWDTPLEEYQRDVLRGEVATRKLLAERGERPRYFRHPYLNTGPDARTKAEFERFLAAHGYQVAPVTIDNMDVMYALAYDHAYRADDRPLMQRLGAAYLDHMEESFAYFEQLSQQLLGREPAQVLMLHANALNADFLPELIRLMRDRGYQFASLEDVLADPAYQLRDEYIGERGLSWLQRWAITQGLDPGTEPRAPEWVRAAAYP